jgi:hypothetical protein
MIYTSGIPSPWHEFLVEIDGLLTQPLELHCIGGFVHAYFHVLPRTTGDIDYYAAVPANLSLDRMVGRNSPLGEK